MMEKEQHTDVKLFRPRATARFLPPINQPRYYKQQFQPSFEPEISIDTIKETPPCYAQKVPVVKLIKTKTTVKLVNNGKQDEKQKISDVIARGVLKGSNNLETSLEGVLDFRGNFEGTFQKDESTDPPSTEYYFEGKISELTILRIEGKEPPEEQKLQLEDLSSFKGYFKGFFIRNSQLQVDLQPKLRFDRIRHIQIESQLLEKDKKQKVEYHVPTMVRFDVRKISEINLQKSSAKIEAILYIDVQLTDQVLEDANVYDQKEHKFKEKHKLTIDFHRGKPLVLPFYNQQDFPQTDEESQYEWDDVWEGIYMEAQWHHHLRRMSYSIRMAYTAEIDNSHGIFYAPFNLNFLRIIVDFHDIKLGKKQGKQIRICPNCCDLTDFNTPTTQRPYTPYTFFQNLQRNLGPNNQYLNKPKDHPKIYQKHIDRLTKIDVTQFTDQGQFKIANNRLSLFPYHKRVLKNKNDLTSDIRWTLGTASRSKLLEAPSVLSVREGYDEFVRTGKSRAFETEQWQFVHIDLPIFKYPVIDMIRIFVPIILLSAISLTIFGQENAKDANGFTELAKRIASGCSLMIAYVALIPLIRADLPPSPSVTLVEILIYLSVIPNFLAIVSVFFCDYLDYQEFFSKYQPFVDGFFLASFVIVLLSIITLLIVMIVYARKDYKSDFTIYKFKRSPMRNMRAPFFLAYIESIKAKRKEDITVQEFEIPYEEEDEQDQKENRKK